jgi:RNA polymerase sigma-70 factor (ECF subfamily)
VTAIFAGKSNPPDQELVRQALSGSLAAFNALVERYQGLVFNICYRLTANQDLAADATQEAFLSAYRHLRQLRDGSFRAWLARIATNCAYDCLRAKRRRQAQSLEELVDEQDRVPALVDDSPSPEQAALAAELSRVVEAAIQELPYDQRAVLVLVDLNGFDYTEVATALQISLGTVKSRLSRARAKLRDKLMADRELLPPGLRL